MILRTTWRRDTCCGTTKVADVQRFGGVQLIGIAPNLWCLAISPVPGVTLGTVNDTRCCTQINIPFAGFATPGQSNRIITFRACYAFGPRLHPARGDKIL